MRPIEPFRPFPVDVLPEPLRSFVTVGARAIGCDESFIVLPLLAALASAIGNSRRIELKSDWKEPSILWTVIVGESGVKKSPPRDLALKPIRKRQDRATREYEKERKAYDKERMRYERALTHWKRGKDDVDPPAKPQEPVMDRYITNDTTIEAVVELLQRQPRGVLTTRDELSAWFASFDRYVQGKGGDAAQWIEMFGGRPVIVDRKTHGPLFVPMATVSVTGGIQPGALRRVLTQENRDNGLAARMLLAWPPRRVRRWTEAEVGPEIEAAVEGVFDRLYGLRLAVDEDGQPCPQTVRLTSPGKKAWVRFYNEHATEQVELMGDLSAAESKLEGYAARLALVVHCVRWAAGDETLASPNEVDEISVAAGVEMSRWFGHEARRVYAMLDEGEAASQRRQLIELIEAKGGSITVRELMRSSQRYPTADVARAALQVLVLAGLGRWVDVAPGKAGGRPTRRFELTDSADVDKTPLDHKETGGCVSVDGEQDPQEEE